MLKRRSELQIAQIENDTAPPLQVLHCLPPQRLRGKSLEFHPFDEPYLERLRNGDFRTQEHFCAYFTYLIQIKLRSRVKSLETVEDIRQETFTRFFTALRAGRILQPERLGSYVNSVCNNVLLEHYRAGSRQVSMDDDEQNQVPDKTDLLGILTTRQNEQQVRQVLEQMPERDRRLLSEVFLEERDKDEVCRDFGVDRDYLRVLVHRAKQSFKLLYLKSHGDDPPEFATV